MENKHCNYCGYFGGMYLIHATYHCPSCKCFIMHEDEQSEQDLFDDDIMEENVHPAIFISDLLIQRG